MYRDEKFEGIHVNGTATASVKPNKAVISLGVVTVGKSAEEANAENAKNMAGVYKTLRAAGVEEKNIVTSGYGVRPQYGTKGNKINGYAVNQTVTVKVTNLEGMGKVLDACVNSGANNVNSVNFDGDTSALETTVLTEALVKARAKAEAVAKAENVKLGKLLAFGEQISRPNARSGGVAYSCSLGGSESCDTEIAAGELTLTATVSAVYGVE